MGYGNNTKMEGNGKEIDDNEKKRIFQSILRH